MKRSKPMKRTAFARKPRSTKSATDRAPARALLKRRSAKQRAMYAGSDGVEGRRALVARLLAERPWCEAGLPRVCTGAAVDVHEKLARSAGGSILDETNCLCLCRACHTWVGDHPREALALGLRLSRYAGRNEPQE